MEKSVAFELKGIGASNISITDGRVNFSGDDEIIVRSNIVLRTAQRVQIEVAKFPAKAFDELFDGIYNTDLQDFVIDKDFKFICAKARSIKSKLISLPAIQKISKKAMAKKLGEVYGVEVLPETSQTEIPFNIFINKDIAHLYIDTSGDALNKRGYRKRTIEAPLKETIAAFMLSQARFKPSRPLYDITCGSGTIPIEAALIGLNIQAGINRNFAGEKLPFIDKKMWNEKRSYYISLEKDIDFKIHASDIDGQAIEIAKENAQIAGVDDYIDFKVCDVKDLQIQQKDGYIISNPPYGVRMGDEQSIQDLYDGMKKLFAKLDNFSYFIITSDDKMQEKIGVNFTKKRKIYNGRINAYLHQYLAQKNF